LSALPPTLPSVRKLHRSFLIAFPAPFIHQETKILLQSPVTKAKPMK